MKDGKEYKVTYTAADEAKTVSEANFVATDAKIAKLAVSTTTIPANDFSEVKINTIDAQGVLLGSYKFSELGQQKITADVKCSANGYKQNDDIYLKNAGDTAEIKTILHTYQYENGVEKDTIEETFIVTAVDETYAGYTFGYSLVGASSNEPAWDASSYKQNTAIPVNETSKAFFNFKNAAGKDKTDKFSISSANADIVLVTGGKAQKSTAMSITGVKEGSTYLLVKDEKGSLIASLPVSVNAARKATRLELSKTSVTVSKANSQAAIDIIPTVYDQYNQKITTGITLNRKALTVKDTNSNVLRVNGNKFTVDGAGMTDGNYYYEVSATVNNVEVKNNVNVTVNKPDGTVYTYGIEVDPTVDVAVDEDSSATNTHKYQIIRIARYQGGVLKDYLSTASLASITISGQDTDNAGKLPAVASDGAVMKVTCGAVYASTGDALKQVVKNGTYKVEAVVKTATNQTTTLATTFVVKNDLVAKYGVNVKIDDMNNYSKQSYGGVTVNDVKTALANKDIFEVTRDNAGATNYNIEHVNITTVPNNNKQVYVNSVEVKVIINTSNVIYIVLPVNRTFTMK